MITAILAVMGACFTAFVFLCLAACTAAPTLADTLDPDHRCHATGPNRQSFAERRR